MTTDAINSKTSRRGIIGSCRFMARTSFVTVNQTRSANTPRAIGRWTYNLTERSQALTSSLGKRQYARSHRNTALRRLAGPYVAASLRQAHLPSPKVTRPSGNSMISRASTMPLLRPSFQTLAETLTGLYAVDVHARSRFFKPRLVLALLRSRSTDQSVARLDRACTTIPGPTQYTIV
jgi:hypothetical protein